MRERNIDLNFSQVRRLIRASRQTEDPGLVRRALGLLQLNRCNNVAETARRVQAVRSTIYRWEDRFWARGIDGLRTNKRGPKPSTVTPELKGYLRGLLDRSPERFGYLTSRWTSQLLSKVLSRRYDYKVHASTIRRLLPEMGYRWGRARPTLHKKDPQKEEKLEAISTAVDSCGGTTATFFIDEVAVELNPKIGFSWMKSGEQTAIETPGNNRKRYLAGALHADTGTITAVAGDGHDTDLLLKLLEKLRLRYRGFSEINVIMDNAPSHRSNRTQKWFEDHSRVERLFQPIYHPWVNRIERLWEQLHATVTRHHRFDDLDELMDAVWQFTEAAEPFPGSNPRLAKAA